LSEPKIVRSRDVYRAPKLNCNCNCRGPGQQPQIESTCTTEYLGQEQEQVEKKSTSYLVPTYVAPITCLVSPLYLHKGDNSKMPVCSKAHLRGTAHHASRFPVRLLPSWTPFHIAYLRPQFCSLLKTPSRDKPRYSVHKARLSRSTALLHIKIPCCRGGGSLPLSLGRRAVAKIAAQKPSLVVYNRASLPPPGTNQAGEQEKSTLQHPTPSLFTILRRRQLMLRIPQILLLPPEPLY
jgi:hypothetical protein